MLHKENNKWFVYDAVSGKETPLRFSIGKEDWLVIKAIREGMVLMSVSNGINFLLDLKTMSLQRIPGSRHILSSIVSNGDVISVY
jgi:hypothetical protein